MTQLDQFLNRAEALLARLEAVLPQADPAPDWNAGSAFRWRKQGGKDGRRYLLRAFGETRAEQDAMSPINHVEKIDLPVYLAAGARDPRCPPEHTEAMYEALVKAGNKPEGLIIQSGEMHGFYKEENNLRLYTEMLDFFDRHIGSGGGEVAASGQ